VRERPAADQPLRGVRVLVTRPAQQAEGLARLIEQAGGAAIRLPTIEIAEPRDGAALTRLIERLDEFDLAIFISPNAVRLGLARVLARGPLPERLEVAAVGRASAAELRRLGARDVLAPAERFDSEALLALPRLRHVAGQSIVIFRGAGGRELLGRTLTARGARVEYAECYRRACPQSDGARLGRLLERGEIDVISATSADGLRNLHEMAGGAGRPQLVQVPLVVVSERVAAAARELGFRAEIGVARRAGDTAMLEAIKAWRAAQNSL